eukprot:2087291-Rhodomonas_salina.1
MDRLGRRAARASVGPPAAGAAPELSDTTQEWWPGLGLTGDDSTGAGTSGSKVGLLVLGCVGHGPRPRYVSSCDTAERILEGRSRFSQAQRDAV